jgi:hypothetical protein
MPRPVNRRTPSSVSSSPASTKRRIVYWNRCHSPGEGRLPAMRRRPTKKRSLQGRLGHPTSSPFPGSHEGAEHKRRPLIWAKPEQANDTCKGVPNLPAIERIFENDASFRDLFPRTSALPSRPKSDFTTNRSIRNCLSHSLHERPGSAAFEAPSQTPIPPLPPLPGLLPCRSLSGWHWQRCDPAHWTITWTNSPSALTGEDRAAGASSSSDSSSRPSSFNRLRTRQ